LNKILVLQHVESEGPGILRQGFEKAGATVEVVPLYQRGATLPPSNTYSAIVSMGGPMNVYEDDRYPFLKAEAEFLNQEIEKGTPVLGICLGAQMIARACGAAVTRAKVEEVGWCPVHITPNGRSDEMFWDFPSQMQVFQWHGDTFEVPRGGELLFKAPLCENQAFRYLNAYALQFHLEVTEELLTVWFKGDPRLKEMMVEWQRRREELEQRVFTLCQRILSLKAFDRTGN